MPPLDLSELEDNSGMDLDSEIPLMHPQDTRSGIFARPAIGATSSEFGKLSGRSMRTSRGNLPFDMWDKQHCIVAACFASGKLSSSSILSGEDEEIPYFPLGHLSSKYC